MLPAHGDSVLLVLHPQPELERGEVLADGVCVHLGLASHHLHGLFPGPGGAEGQHLLQLVTGLHRAVEVTLMQRLSRITFDILS